MNILCCVFSWKGQFDNAVKLQEQLSPLLDVIVINSDDDNTKDGWIDIGNECYFSDQFKTALNLFDSSKYDALWHICADVSCDNWEPILQSAKDNFIKYNWGVFSPNVNYTFYTKEMTDVYTLDDNISVVANTDELCWFIHKDFILEIQKNINLMDNNILGWGWDLLICAFSHLQKRYVIRDYSFEVKHPASTGYMKDQAEREMQEMFSKCSSQIQQIIYLIKTKPINLSSIYNKELDISSFSVYNTVTGSCT